MYENPGRAPLPKPMLLYLLAEATWKTSEQNCKTFSLNLEIYRINRDWFLHQKPICEKSL